MSDSEFIKEIMEIIFSSNDMPKVTVEQFAEITSSFLQQSSNK